MRIILKIFFLAISCVVYATGYKPIYPAHDHKHDKWNTQPRDIIKQFRAYTVSFDGKDSDGSEEENNKLGLPEWVAYQINKTDHPLLKSPRRPRS
jgi:endonuclease G, mitochondrial